jgi:hypothetical protein
LNSPPFTSIFRASAQLLKQRREFRLLCRVQPCQPRTERFRQERKPARHGLAPLGCKDEPVATQIRAIEALDVKLSAEEFGRLEALTKPTFGFPQSMQPWFAAIHNGGTSVNGVSAPPSPFVVEKGDKIY